ncbi:MAG: transposase [Saprospiraceae bacterium]|nr:transposase [Saprospiraceae bacterium]
MTNYLKTIEIEERLNKLLDLSILEKQLNDPVLCKQTITFFRGMVKLKHALFPFLYHADVPFDNNGSERAFRMVKVKTKISSQFKSLQQEFAIIRSVIGSAIKNKKNVLTAIADLLALSLPEAAG